MALSPFDPRATLHADLLRLTRGLGGLRLAIADGVDRLEALNGALRLGFPTLDAYARERLGRSGRWLGDVRTLARRLVGLPILRDAYLAGRLSISKAELLARHLTRRAEGGESGDAVRQLQALILARTMTVRELRGYLGGSGPAADEADGTRCRWVQLTRHVDRVDAVAFEGAVRLMNALGASSRTEAIEGLLAEAMTTLINRGLVGANDLIDRIGGSWPPVRPEPSSSPPTSTTSPPTDIGPTDTAAPAVNPHLIDPEVTSLEGLDEALCSLAAELARRDLRLGQLALEAERVGLAHALGHESVDDFYREALGMAPSSMAARIALARRVARLTRLEDRIHHGTIGFETATLLARVASPETENAWLALADISTVKLFREQVDAAELHARVHGQPLDRLAPPTPDQVEDARDLERAVFAMVLVPTEGMPEQPAVPELAELADLVRDGPMSVGVGTVPLRLTLPEDLATFWRELEAEYDDAYVRPGAPSFVAMLVASTLETWRGATRLPAYGDIYLRDRFRCQSPTCRSRNCTPHHIVFRSRGGDDAPSNLVSLCERCHLDLVHGHHLTVSGLAPHALRWEARAYSATGDTHRDLQTGVQASDPSGQASGDREAEWLYGRRHRAARSSKRHDRSHDPEDRGRGALRDHRRAEARPRRTAAGPPGPRALRRRGPADRPVQVVPHRVPRAVRGLGR